MNEPCWYCKKEVGWESDGELERKCDNCGILNDRNLYPPVTEKKEEDVANLSDLRKNLRKEDVATGDIIKFIDAGEIKDVDFSPAQDGSKVETVFQATVELPSGKQKIYTPNATTRGILSEKWGEDTDAWVGKEATAKFIDQLSFGKLTKVLILEPIE